MAGLNVRLNQQDIDTANRLLNGVKNGAKRAITRTLSRTLDKAATRANQEIRKDVRLTATYVRGKLLKNKPSFSKPTAILSAEKRGVLLTRYKYRVLAKGKGVRVWVKQSGSSADMPSAFLVRNLKNSGADGIALPPGIKAPRDQGITSSGGTQFDVLHGPSVSQVFTEVKDEIEPEMSAFATQELLRQIDVILGN